MSMTRIIGDIHGLWHEYHALVVDGNHNGVENSIQVGDFGIGFAGPYWHDRVNEFHSEGNRRFIRGNHDDPNRCRQTVGWIPDGLIENDVMFIGGAWSIDHAYRTEGVSWWADEEVSVKAFNMMIDMYEMVKPRVMITHDCPSSISKSMFIDMDLGHSRVHHKTRTGEAFQAMLDIHQPELWVFGHWHHTMAHTRGRTTYVCLGEMDYIDVDLDDLDQIHDAIANMRS